MSNEKQDPRIAALEERQEGRFGVSVEENRVQDVICEWRNGEAWFVFGGQGFKNTAVPADPYLALLREVRKWPLERPRLSDRIAFGVRSGARDGE